MRRPSAFPSALVVSVSLAALAYDPAAPAADPKRALLLLVGLGALAAAAARGEPAHLGKAACAWIALVIWSAVTTLWGGPGALRDLAGWVGAAALIVACSTMNESDRKDTAQWTAMLTGGGAALWAMLQHARGARGIFVHGGQGNGNWLGLLLALTLPLSIGAMATWWRDSPRWVRGLVACSIALQAHGLLIAHSRVAWAGLAIGFVSWLLVSRPALPLRIGALVAAAGLVIALAWTSRFAPQGPTNAERGVTASASDVELSTAWEGRVWIWRTSLDVATDSLPWGTGLGRFSHAYLQEQGSRLARMEAGSHRFENAVTAHSDWIQIAAESGPIGLALLVLGWLYAMRDAWRERWGGSCASLTAFAVCAWGDSPLRQPAIVAVLALLVAAVSARSKAHIAASKWKAAPLAIAAAALLACSSQNWIASRWVTRSRGEPPELAITTLERAQRVDPRHGEAALALGLAWLEAGDTDRALAALVRSRPLIANVGTDIAIGNAWLQASNADRAIDAYRSALSVYPRSFRAHANLAEALRMTGNLEEARTHLTIAKSLWPGNPHLPELEERLQEARAAEPGGSAR